MSHSQHLLQRRIPFIPSSWQIENIQSSNIPQYIVSLGRFPTPIHRINYQEIDDLNIELYIKRDDLSSCDLSGNKVRKLEFLLSEALTSNDSGELNDSVITIGGLQSNHARATAVASRQLGLEPHLILRTPVTPEEVDITGNLLWNRLISSKIYTVTPSAYAQLGSNYLVEQLKDQLISQGKRPYCIPVGGSNSLGSFGYMECIKEILSYPQSFDHIIFACGSGGTAAGLAIGSRLSGSVSQLHAIGVCDSPKYFYDHIEAVAIELGINMKKFGKVEDWLNIYSGQGLGYARSSDEELKCLLNFSSSTGILLDPVYSGKAFYYLLNNLLKNNEVFKPGQRILFIHTGGTFGLYDKSSQILPLLDKENVTKMQIKGRT